MSIEFRCPQCQKLLRVPSESAGAKAKCPQCGTISDVPQAESAESDDQEDPAGLSRSQGANPFAEGDQLLPPAAKPASSDPVNPYSTPVGGYELASSMPSFSNEVAATPVDAGQVISYAWQVWKSNLGILVGITVVVLAITLLLTGVQEGIEAVFKEQGSEVLGGVLGAVVSVFNNLVQIFLGIGQAQIVLKLLRRQPAEFRELFGGGPLFLRVLGASILFGIAMVAGLIACFVPGIILALFFWPFYWLLVDQKATAIESFGMASPLGKANVGTTIVLALAGGGIMLVGFLAFCVGILFAAPLVSLMWGTAYLMMSGQITIKPQY